MTDFFRFPHTPHLAWLGPGEPRDDKVLDRDEVAQLLAHDVVVEEKVDGANLGFSVGEDGELRVQNRGSYLQRQHVHPQFGPLWSWVSPRQTELANALWPDLMLFGEWCVAVHSIRYDLLPDWFLGFDVYDRGAGRFWDTHQRDSLLATLGLTPVPRLGDGRFTLNELSHMIDRSRLGNVAMEGLVVRHQSDGWSLNRAKLVRPSFTQGIEEHWSRGPLRRNAVVGGFAR